MMFVRHLGMNSAQSANLKELEMKEFMLIYKGGDPEWLEKTTPEEMKEYMGRWGAWMGNLTEQGKLVSGGSPLNFGGKRLNGKGVVTDIASSEFKEIVSGYSIIKAESESEALEIAKSCPIVENPEGIIDVREVSAM